MLDALERLGVHLPSLLIFTANFLVLWGVLYVFAFKPFARKLRERTEEERRWASEKERADELINEANSIREGTLTKARLEHDAILRAANELAERNVDDGVKRSRKAAEVQLKRARSQMRRESMQAYQTLRDSFVEIVISAAERSLQQSLDEEVRENLISAAIEEMLNMRWEPPGTKSMVFVVVTTAVPMNSEQEEQISDFLARTIKGEFRLSYKVDSSVVGGLSIRTNDWLLDMTVAGRLDRLKKHLLDTTTKL